MPLVCRNFGIRITRIMMVHKLKCKGITVYRYGSKDKQVLNIGHILRKKLGKQSMNMSMLILNTPEAVQILRLALYNII